MSIERFARVHESFTQRAGSRSIVLMSGNRASPAAGDRKCLAHARTRVGSASARPAGPPREEQPSPVRVSALAILNHSLEPCPTVGGDGVGVCSGAGREPETDCGAGRGAGRGRPRAPPAAAPGRRRAAPPGGRGGGAGGASCCAPAWPRTPSTRPRLLARARPPPGRPAGAAQRPGGLRQDHPAGPVARRRAGPAAGGLGHPGRPRRRGGPRGAHLVAALRPRFPGAGRAALALLRLPGAVAPADLGAALAEDLAGAGRRGRASVLDDYQEVRDGGVHAVLDALLQHPPPGLRLVLATRADPPLPLARLRARGQLVELRAADLRFTPAEAARLPGPRPPRAARAGDGRRRWPPAPRGGRPGCAWRPSRCRGRARPRARRRRPPRARQPLAAGLPAGGGVRAPAGGAAGLPAAHGGARAPLRPAVRRPAGGRPRPPGRDAAERTRRGPAAASGRAALAAVLRANLFLTPLDEPAPDPSGGEPARPRGGPAGGGSPGTATTSSSATSCSASCASAWGPAAERALHARAGAWFAGAGLVEEGVHPPPGRRGRRRGGGAGGAPRPGAARGGLPALERWLGLLPPAAVAGRPALLVARAWVAQRRGRNEALPALLAAAQAALDARQPASLARRRRIGAGDASAAGPRGAGGGARRPDRVAVLRRGRRAGRARGGRARPGPAARGGRPRPRGGHRDAAAGRPRRRRPRRRPAAARGAPRGATGSAGAEAASALPGIGVALVLAGRHHEAAGAGRALLELGRAPGLAERPAAGATSSSARCSTSGTTSQAAEQHLTAALEERDRVRLMALRVGTFGLALALQAQGRAGEADAVLDRLGDATAADGQRRGAGPGGGLPGAPGPAARRARPGPRAGCPRPAASRRTGWTRCWTPRR